MRAEGRRREAGGALDLDGDGAAGGGEFGEDGGHPLGDRAGIVSAKYRYGYVGVELIVDAFEMFTFETAEFWFGFGVDEGERWPFFFRSAVCRTFIFGSWWRGVL